MAPLILLGRIRRLVRGVLPRQPSQWLLGRAHHPWVGLAPLALLGIVVHFGAYRPHWIWTLLVIYGIASFGLDAVADALHQLWDRGRIWQDTICPRCDGHGGGGEFGFPDFPEEPPGHGLRSPTANRSGYSPTSFTPKAS
ncbi:hypothetical protein RM717_24530 [Streptomyces griseus]|uniref:Integral membrane protein n=1 Tax=Streptomyces stephensoniae TaxID=3375367 RepID=A0ABU2W732_9ACTN|nr:hypothetical protein [Streptomyces griseus]MDT0493671.1 hypothetical protein [Streptomyces griseus]